MAFLSGSGNGNGNGNVIDEKFDPLIRQVAIRLANKVSYLPKFVISRLSDDELYDLLGKNLSKLPDGEADRILEAELQTMFAPLGAVLSFLFPRTNRITPPKPPVPEPQIREPVALKDFIIISVLYVASLGSIYYGFRWLFKFLDPDPVFYVSKKPYVSEEHKKLLRKRFCPTTSELKEEDEEEEEVVVEHHQEDIPSTSTVDDPNSRSPSPCS